MEGLVRGYAQSMTIPHTQADHREPRVVDIRINLDELGEGDECVWKALDEVMPSARQFHKHKPPRNPRVVDIRFNQGELVEGNEYMWKALDEAMPRLFLRQCAFRNRYSC